MYRSFKDIQGVIEYLNVIFWGEINLVIVYIFLNLKIDGFRMLYF